MKKEPVKIDTSERVIVSNPMVGICGCQICAVADATDEEILAVANRDNPSGTSAGWNKVVRTVEDIPKFANKNVKLLPVDCESAVGRVHYLVLC